MRSFVINVVRPDNTVYGTNEALHGYPEADGASTYVPRSKHSFGHRAEYQDACYEVHDGDERKCWIHAIGAPEREWTFA